METGSKILTGAAATVILALVGHAVTGDQFVSGLEQKAQTELAARGIDGASVRFGRAPLSRSAVVDGALPDSAKQEALNVVRAVPGVSGASWGAQEAADTARSEEPPESASVGGGQDPAAKCQSDVDKVMQSQNISFRSGSAYLSLETRQILDQLAAVLKTCDGQSITVEGHTDDNGNREVNREMSQERADRIKAGLVERGIPEALITATGFGATQPLADGSGAAADAQNRRIAIGVAATGGSPQNAASAAPQNDAKAQQAGLSIPLLLENLLLLLATFAIGLMIGWLFWGRNHENF